MAKKQKKQEAQPCAWRVVAVVKNTDLRYITSEIEDHDYIIEKYGLQPGHSVAFINRALNRCRVVTRCDYNNPRT